jgi:hypothetical protein
MTLKIIYCPVGLELDLSSKNKRKKLLNKSTRKKKIGKKKAYGKKQNFK